MRAYLHPTRMKILTILAGSPHTQSETAALLGVHPANLAHHFKILESADLIQSLTGSGGRGVPHPYRASARKFELAPSPGALENPAAEVLALLRDDLNHAITRLEETPSGESNPPMIGLVMGSSIPNARFLEFSERLQALIREFESSSAPDGTPYTLNLSLYPFRKDYGPIERIRITSKNPQGEKPCSHSTPRSGQP